jgi:hypothetical protein
MTIIASLISLKDDVSIDSYLYEFRSLLDKVCPNSKKTEYINVNCYYASMDILAFDDRAICNEDKSFTAIAGDPLIREKLGDNRLNDTRLIHDSFRNGKYLIQLKKSRGVFAGINYCEKTNCVFAFTDKLGVRPVYFYRDENIVIFSSLIGLITGLSFVDKVIDFLGMCEHLSVGYSFGEKTPYKNIKLLKGGHIFNYNIAQNRMKYYQYWNWLDIPAIKNVNDDVVEEIFGVFDDAVNIRLSDKNKEIAFLSGGLDSRCIVSLLKEKVLDVTTFNFSTENSQDKSLAMMFAKKIGVTHIEKTFKKLSFPNWSMLMRESLNEIECCNKSLQDKSDIVWSGDGGSVGAGYVYIDEGIIESIKTNQVECAVKDIVGFDLELHQKIFRLKFHYQINLMVKKIAKENFPIIKQDIGKSAYYYLLTNDQRRHLAVHFETIGQHKTEFLLPFFDSDFLTKIFSIPSNDMLYHRFYMKLFDCFPESAREVPWQIYPKHKPCPLEIDIDLSYQWKSNKKTIRYSENIKTIRELFKLLITKKQMFKYIHRHKIAFAMIMHFLNIKNYAYIIRTLNRFKNIDLS